MALKTTVADSKDQRRAERLRVQRILWEHSSIKRVRMCGRHGITPSGEVVVKHLASPDGSRSAGFGGLHTCGSVWACPECNSKIAASRAADIALAVKRWEDNGGRVAMVTLTVRHHAHHSLKTVWDAVSAGWARVTSGREWAAENREYGFEFGGKTRIGWVRAVEVTVGKNGWHVHVHCLLFLPGLMDLDGLSCSMFQRWRSGVTEAGVGAPSARHGGLDARWIDSAEAISRYLAKCTYPDAPANQAGAAAAGENAARVAGYEAAGGAMKIARRGNRAPFEVLRDFVATGDLDDLDLWHEWERGSRGRRQMTWSRWFKGWLQMDELTDEEIACAAIDGDEIARIAADQWKRLRHHKAAILRAAETLPLDYLQRTSPNQWVTVMVARARRESPPGVG